MLLSFAVAFVYVAVYLRAKRIGKSYGEFVCVKALSFRLWRCDFFGSGAKQTSGNVFTACHHIRLHPHLDPLPLHAYWLFVVG